MKLDSVAPEIERSGEVKENGFKIADNSVAFKTLRKYIYSNPIRTICREVPSNARDAHREVGKSDLPIEIKLPNDLDPTFWVRDYGPGITPDRMENVFIVFFASTKRQDNKQTGGFGLGAKSPLAYSDSFNIETITPDENGQMIKRSYCAFIDESEKGSMALLGEELTDEPQGTKISLPVKSNDFYRFESEILESLYYWTPRPLIMGREANVWEAKSEEFKDFSGIGKHCIWEMNTYSHPKSKIILDGISYSLSEKDIVEDWDSLDKDFQSFIENSGFKFIFDCGALSVTANRESIEYNTNSRTKLYETIKEIYDFICGNLQSQLDSCADWQTALVKYTELRKGSIAFMLKGGWKWNGEPLIYDVPCEGTTACYNIGRNDGRLHKEWGNRHLNAAKECVVVVNDEGDNVKTLNRNKIMHLIKEKGFSTVYFVKSFSNDKAKESLYTNFPSFCKTFFMSSKVPKMKNPRNSNFKVTATGEKVKGIRFRSFTGLCGRGYNHAFQWEAFDTETVPTEMLYVIVHERMFQLFGRHSNNYYNLQSFRNAFGIKIYGVVERELNEYKHLPWKKVEDYVLEQAKSYPATQDVTNSMSEDFSDLFELIKEGKLTVKGLALDYYNKSVAAMAKKTKKREKDNLVAQVFSMEDIRSKVKLVRHVEDLVDTKEAFQERYPIAAKAYNFDCVEDWQWYFDNKD